MHSSEPYNAHTPPIQRWNGATPLVMSGIVLVMVVMDLIRHGFRAPRHDEGAADHIAMLLMFGRYPSSSAFYGRGEKRSNASRRC